ncbi:MAG: hypothetical protein R3F14_29725, partial [Polyangiaceae bacterium]
LLGGPESSPAPPVVRPPPAPARGGPARAAAVPSRAPTGGPQLTLDQYAWLVVTCELYPAYSEATLARYGLSGPGAHAAIDAYWGEKMAAEPALAARYSELCAAARNYLLQPR